MPCADQNCTQDDQTVNPDVEATVARIHCQFRTVSQFVATPRQDESSFIEAPSKRYNSGDITVQISTHFNAVEQMQASAWASGVAPSEYIEIVLTGTKP